MLSIDPDAPGSRDTIAGVLAPEGPHQEIGSEKM